MESDASTVTIRRLNDALRRSGEGGRIMITRGLHALGRETVAKVLRDVSTFDAFTVDNDPYGEHDCAVMTIEGIRIIWKIDYYDLAMKMGSEDPADPSITARVLTIMLAEEY